jgi:hypothetical protein
LLALDGSNWQRVDLFEFQRDMIAVLTAQVNNFSVISWQEQKLHAMR